MIKIEIVKRETFWKERPLVCICKTKDFEIWREKVVDEPDNVNNVDKSVDNFDFEKELLKFRGGKGRWKNIRSR